MLRRPLAVLCLATPLALPSLAFAETAREAYEAAGAVRLDAAEAQALYGEKTLVGVSGSGNRAVAVFSQEGRGWMLAGPDLDRRDEATWRIDEDGRFCAGWQAWRDGAEACFVTYRLGDAYSNFAEDGSLNFDFVTLP